VLILHQELGLDHLQLDAHMPELVSEQKVGILEGEAIARPFLRGCALLFLLESGGAFR
jgi:hypothetical protein